LYARGLRYRIDRPIEGLPRRRADLTFASRKLVVFVDGCFWHSCPDHGTWPKRNDAWWAAKLQRNVERDHETNCHLEALGWKVVRVWEHEEPEDAADRIMGLIGSIQDAR
jgi:DNA mismatch endonuclease (patch repair protein)